MDNIQAKALLDTFVQFQVTLSKVKRHNTLEEQAEEIASSCFSSGGTETCNLISHFDDLEKAILDRLKEMFCCHTCKKHILGDKIKSEFADDPSFCSTQCLNQFHEFECSWE